MGLDLTFWQNVLAAVTAAAIIALGALIGRVFISRSKQHGIGARLSSLKQRRRVTSLAIFVLVGMVVGGSLGAAVWAILPRTAPSERVAPPMSVATPPAKPELYTGYARVGRIPESAPPGQAELRILHLVPPESGRGGLGIDDARPNDPVSPSIYRCLIRNMGSIALQDVRLEFLAWFYEKSGSSAQRYTVPIPLLGPGAEYVLYIRNDGGGGAQVDLPPEAAVRIPPSGDSLGIALKWDPQNTPDLPQQGSLPFDGAYLRPR